MTSKNKPPRQASSRKEIQPKIQGEAGSEQDLAKLVASLSDEKRLELISVLQVSRVQTTFSGPLPPPEDFKKYNEVLPNAADRILSMAENEQKIRSDGQNKMLTNDQRRINGAIGIGASMIAVAGLATWLGYAHIALPLGLAGMVHSLIRLVLFWLGRQQNGNGSQP